MGQVVSEEALALQFSHQISQKVTLVYTILPRYYDIHISTFLLASAIGSTNFNPIHIQGRYYSLNDVSDEFIHTGYLFSWDFLLELFEVFQAYFLVAIEQVRSFAHVFNGLDT